MDVWFTIFLLYDNYDEMEFWYVNFQACPVILNKVHCKKKYIYMIDWFVWEFDSLISIFFSSSSSFISIIMHAVHHMRWTSKRCHLGLTRLDAASKSKDKRVLTPNSQTWGFQSCGVKTVQQMNTPIGFSLQVDAEIKQETWLIQLRTYANKNLRKPLN